MKIDPLRWSCAVAATVAGLLLVPVHANSARDLRGMALELCRLYGTWDPTMTRTSVPEPPPRRYQQWDALFSANATATIVVNYDANFPPHVKAAFQAAVDIWAGQLVSSVPITISASWIPLSEGQLGGVTAFYMQTGAGRPGTWYPKALLDQLAGQDVLPGSTGVNAAFNSALPNWYFGTDGNPGPEQYDFESVVLHELAHGLGFGGTATDDGTRGSIGTGSQIQPAIFDTFVETAARQSILNTALFPNPSVALHDAYTSDGSWSYDPFTGKYLPLDPGTGLYWSGANGAAAAGSGGKRPRLDARAPFTAGYNYQHLNEVTYPRGDANSLMRRFLFTGESNHSPGPIALAMFQDEGWTLACPYTLSPTSATTGFGGTTGSVTVTTNAGCVWNATAPAGSFVTITGGASGSGTGTVTYSVAAATAPRTAALTIAGIPFEVTQGPAITVDRKTLAFGATNAGGTLSNQTSAQTVTVSISGVAGAAWTATSNAPWLKVMGGAGTGTGAFSVSVQSDATLANQANATGSISVASASVSNSPQTITVTLSTVAPGVSSPPTGSFDTPAEGSTISGSVAVTGWALDNIEVMKVSIFRDAHAGDPAGAIVNGRVFVGDASFVEGARSDVEAAAPGSPMNYRAGWGYLMLTRGLIWDGKGPFKIYAVATDKEGNTTTLGSKTITVDNAGATKPFGSIDTPAPGEPISGTYPNTGWVLVPNSTIPASGVQVFIDTTQVAGIPSTSAREDISAGFPGFDASQAGRGLFINTALFSNGTHTIGWLVTAANGQAEGIGSRFIRIQNASQVTTTARLINQPAATLPGTDNGATVRVATSVDPKAPQRTVRPDAFGRRHVRIAELDPVVIRKVNGDVVYMVANGQLRALPLGASFDAARGTFFWQTSAGFVGDYEFVVVDESRADARRLTRLVVSVGRTPVAVPAP